MAQVRLDEEVVAALQRVMDRQGGSMSQQANAKLRQALGLNVPHIKSLTGQATPRTGNASVSGARPKCLHPISRRVGEHCMICGTKVGARRKASG